jgi:CRISPR-associated protein Cmx8
LAKTKETTTIDILTLDYQLSELPSSQHRSGLAGLVLTERWLKRQPSFKEKERNGAVLTWTRLDARGATLQINQAGLAAIFDEIYAANLEEQERPQPFKNKNKEIIPPLREEERDEVDPKTGKEKIDSKTGELKKKKVYIYPVVIPKGSFLADPSYDQSSDGKKGHWIKLWRDMIWSILRGVPATRGPFEERANGDYEEDALKIWKELIQPSDYPVDLPSTYFLGAQASNAENVPFRDKARFQFLLHFWIYVAQIYVPVVTNNENKREFVGYALAIPDVANLKTFCDELPEVLRGRGVELSGYRPRDCIVDLAVESALDVMKRLRDSLAIRAGEKATGDLVLGVDVIHTNKEGNNVRLLSVSRLDPDYPMIDEYARIRKAIWSPLFRKQRLLNLVKNQSWYTGFDALLCSLPYEQSIGNDYFRHDVRESFKYEVNVMSEETKTTLDGEAVLPSTETDSSISETSYEVLIYKLVSAYIRQKLESKYQLKWSAVKDDPSKKVDYEKNKEKIAKSAFLDIRSRTEKTDFINYFASTLCSVPQYLKPEDFVILTRALYDETDKVRTLTLLALSANA